MRVFKIIKYINLKIDFAISSENGSWTVTHINHLTPWCSDYHYCKILFIKAWNQVLRRFKSCSRRIGDSRYWGALAMVLAGNKAKRLSLDNHTTKAIHHHYHHHHHHHHHKMITLCILSAKQELSMIQIQK